MAKRFFEYDLPNGIHLIVQPMVDFQSAAYTILVPGGVVNDSPEALGSANLLSDWISRGAGSMDNRALMTEMDNLGIQRSENAELIHSSFVGTTLAKHLPRALELTADIILRPMLDAELFEQCRAGTIQELESIEDDPTQKLFLELRERAMPSPFGRPMLGRPEHVKSMSHEAVSSFYRDNFRPNGTIIGVAGAVDADKVRDLIASMFGDWQKKEAPPLQIVRQKPSRGHLISEKVQTHIGITYETIRYDDPDYYNAHGAVSVLSGGMSSRLFTEVREKRGLCYSVGASYVPLKQAGFVFCHAGTTNDRAGETLDVLLTELRRLGDGISQEEVDRAKVGLKSTLVMQEESTSARASILARGWYNLERVRSVEEALAEIDKLTPTSILDFLHRHPPGDFSILTLGPNPLEKNA